MKTWFVFLMACAGGAKPQSAPQSLCHTTVMQNCTGVPENAGAAEVEVCDECADDSQCAAKPGGACRETGDGMCFGPRHLICKYPDAKCGGRICAEPAHRLPPSSAPGD